MRFCELERQARLMLAKAGVDSPGLCARVLTAHVAGCDRTAYLLAEEREATPKQQELQRELVRRRGRGEPLAYILGKKEFYKYEFVVSPAVLIPRPETELLVELALAHVSAQTASFADLGCGSGCIGVSLLRDRPAWRGILLESSQEALAVAKINAAGVEAVLLRADMFAAPLRPQSCDLVVSNPPYIGPDENVMGETLAYEPGLALFSGEGGLAHIRAVISCASAALKPGGWLILEHGWRQEQAVGEMLLRRGFGECRSHADLAGLPRCAMARKK